jgi:flagellar hook-length control protein FliK
LSNVALDPIPQWPQRPEPGSNRAGSSSMDPSPSRFDALLDNTSSDVRPAPSEQYDRSRAPDRRDDARAADDRAAAQSRAADDRATAQSRAGDARAADRQKAADDRTTQVADDTKTQQDSDKAAAAKNRPAAGASDATQAKAKPAANAAGATQAQAKSQGKPADKTSDATQATDTPAQPADAAAGAAQAKAATTAAAAVIGDAGTAVKKSGKTAQADKDTAAAATTTPTPDPNAVVTQVAVIAVPVNPLATIAPSAGAAAAKTADGIAPIDASLTPADAAGKPGAAMQAAAGTAAERAAAATAGADAKATDPAQQESFKALVEAAGAKTPTGAGAKADHTDKAKPAEQSKTASTNSAKPSATDAAQPAGADEQVVKTGAATPHQTQPQSAEHVGPAGPAGRPAASEIRADAITATAPTNAQAGSNAPILPLNLAQPIALPLSTMFQVAAPKADANVDAAVPVAGLAVEIVSRAQEGGKRFDIRLDPPELGRVDVRLDVDDAGKVTSHLVVERSETLDLLRRDQPQLERALQQAGLNTDGGLQFSLRDQNSAQRDQTPRDNSTSTSQLIVPDDEAAAAEAARRGYGRLLGRAGGVDIRI